MEEIKLDFKKKTHSVDLKLKNNDIEAMLYKIITNYQWMQINDKLHKEEIDQKEEITIKTFYINRNEITNSIKIQQNPIKSNTLYNIIFKNYKYIIKGANLSNPMENCKNNFASKKN